MTPAKLSGTHRIFGTSEAGKCKYDIQSLAGIFPKGFIGAACRSVPRPRGHTLLVHWNKNKLTIGKERHQPTNKNIDSGSSSSRRR